MLAGLAAASMDEAERSTEVSMEELSELVDTAGGEVAAVVLQQRQTPDPRSFLGEGKVEELRQAKLVDGFSFTKGCPVLKVPGTGTGSKPKNRETLLFDLQDDPEELRPIQNEAIEKRMTSLMVDLMKANDAPEEQYDRLGLR